MLRNKSIKPHNLWDFFLNEVLSLNAQESMSMLAVGADGGVPQ